MRVSAGKEMSLATDSAEKVDLAEQQKRASAFPWPTKTQLTPGAEIQTYTLTSPFHSPGSQLRHLMLRPTDAAGATFEIESVRLDLPEGTSGQHCVRRRMAGAEGDLPRIGRRPRAGNHRSSP